MVSTSTARGLTFQVSDITGQKVFTASDVPPDSTVGEMIGTLLPRIGFVQRANGEQVAYRARLDREGRHLNASERVSDAIQPDDRIVLAPTIEAG